jgi:transposase
MRRYEVSDAQFSAVADLSPANGRRGGQWRDHRTVLNAVLWVLHTGAQWRELPGRYGPWQAAHRRLTRWRADGTLARLLGRLHLRLDAAGLIDHDLWCVDATSVRARRAAAGGKSRPARRAGRPRPGPQPGRVLDQTAPGHGRRRGAAGRAGDGRPGA